MSGKIVRILKGTAVAAVWLLIWEIVYLSVKQEILIVSPVQVFTRIIKLMGETAFWLTAGASILRVLTGFFMAVITGIVLAVITTAVPMTYEFFYPAISVIKATPITSFIILALVWIRSPGVPVFMAFLMVLPIIWSNISEGIKNTDRKLLEMAEVYKFGLYKKIKVIYIPFVMPYFLSAFKTGLGFSWKAGVAAEVIGTPDNSIGTELYNAKIYLDTDYLFAWTVIIIVMSVIIEKLFMRLISIAGSKILRAPGAGNRV